MSPKAIGISSWSIALNENVVVLKLNNGQAITHSQVSIFLSLRTYKPSFNKQARSLSKDNGWLRRSFNWNHLKYPEILIMVEVGNTNPQHK